MVAGDTWTTLCLVNARNQCAMILPVELLGKNYDSRCSEYISEVCLLSERVDIDNVMDRFRLFIGWYIWINLPYGWYRHIVHYTIEQTVHTKYMQVLNIKSQSTKIKWRYVPYVQEFNTATETHRPIILTYQYVQRKWDIHDICLKNNAILYVD